MSASRTFRISLAALLLGLVVAVAQTVRNAQWLASLTPPVAGGTTYTYFLSENFDIPDLVWTNFTGTPDYAYTTAPAPLEGTKSLYLDGSAADVAADTGLGGARAEFWFYAMFNMQEAPGGTRHIFEAVEGATVRFFVSIGTARRLNVGVHSASSNFVTDALATNTTYHIWAHFKGSDGTGDVCFSTSAGTKPDSTSTAWTNVVHTAETSPQHLRMLSDWATSTGGKFIWDKVRMSLNEIGTNPN